MATVEKLRAEFGAGFSTTIVVPSDLRYQWRNEVSHFTGGVEVRPKEYEGGASCIMVDGTAAKRDVLYDRIIAERPAYSIISYNHVVNDYTKVEKLPWDAGVLDECFVGSTPVSTPQGARIIRDLRPGDEVHNAHGVGVVQHVHRRRASSLIRVSTSAGEEIVCTTHHPFFTNEGVRWASELKEGDQLYDRESVLRVVRGEHQPQTTSDQVLQQVVFSPLAYLPAVVARGLHAGASSQNFSSPSQVAVRESGAGGSAGPADRYVTAIYRPEDSRENKLYATRDRAPSSGSGGQRAGAYCSSTAATRPTWRGVGQRVPSSAAGVSGRGLPDVLQAGSGVPKEVARCGGRRRVPQQSSCSCQGSEERHQARGAWVVGVEVLEPGSADFIRCSGGEDRVDVYDLTVSGHPSYYAHDVLVHNCTFIKSFESDRTQAMKTITPEFRFGLTGDPIENSASDLFSIMEWIDPTVLGRWDIYDASFIVRHPQRGYVIKSINLDVLHEKMNRSGAWVLKKASDPDVAPYMPVRHPPREHTVKLDADTAELYELIADDLLEELGKLKSAGQGGVDVGAMYMGERTGANKGHGKASARLAALRMLLAHPYVLRQSARRYQDAPLKPKRRTRITLPDGTSRYVMAHPPKPGSAYAAELLEDGLLDDLVTAPKMELTIGLLDELLEDDERNKIVVFSFFKDALRWMAAQYQGEHVLYTGDLTAKARHARKLAFQRDPAIRLFFTSDTGAYGTDLPQANHLVNYDIPYSAGQKRQRDARIIRASSLDYWSHVQVHNIVVEGSAEEFYYDKTMRRIALGDAVKTGNRREVTMTVSSLARWIEEHTV